MYVVVFLQRKRRSFRFGRSEEVEVKSEPEDFQASISGGLTEEKER